MPVAFSGGLILFAMPALGVPPPIQIGKCADTFIQEVGTRLSDGAIGASIEGSVTSVSLSNGIYLVSYDEIAPLKSSKGGEESQTLFTFHSQQLSSPGDGRRRFYSLFNYRTRQTVKLLDAQHSCGGA